MSLNRSAAYLISFGLLGVTAFFGKDGIGDFRESATVAQKICSVAVMAYGVFALAALTGLVARKPWAVWAVGAWTASMIVAGTLAPRAWGDVAPAWWVTLLSAVVILVIGLGVMQAVRYLVTSSRDATNRT
jgi:hypothetical protein